MTSALFSPFKLRGLALANRIVVSPMCQFIAPEAKVNDWHLMLLGGLSLGGSGDLVMTEATGVNHEGRLSTGCTTLSSDEQEVALKRVIDFCKKYGVAKHGIQLGHAGRKGSVHPPALGNKPLKPEEGAWQTVAPSALAYADGWPTPHPLTVEEIAKTKDDFVDALRRADRIGYDLIQVQMCHGYLLHQFLSPLSNQREDQYGGSLANRMRFPLEVFAAMRAAWPAERPMGVRVSGTDWVDGGWDLPQTIELAKQLKALGCDFIDVSTGALDPRQKIPLSLGYQVPFAEAVRREADIPTMAVGLITGVQQAEQIVASGQADFICMGRGALWDPRWAWHAAEELGAEVPYAPGTMACHPAGRPWVFPTRQPK